MVDFNAYFEYISEGYLINKVTRYGGKDGKSPVATKGAVAGTIPSNEYASLCLNYKNYLTHRVIWEMHFGVIPEGMQIDHIDGDITNNKITNLRLVDQKLNNRNRSKRCESLMAGVSLRKFFRRGVVYQYWRVSWTELNGQDRTKDFSVLKLGYDKALSVATYFRFSVMERLNSEGAGYSSRHIGEIQ